MAGQDRDDDIRIEHPNRDKASSKATRLIVVLLLLVSAGLTAVVSVGGWDTLQGARALQVAYIGLYVLLAFLVLRWRRGLSCHHSANGTERF
jgi:high-affinity Fe2+/Pb2+ permease